MNLLNLIQRPSVPEPWSEGDKIPWDEPDFSHRMLRVHLSQDHDWASRRVSKIDAQIAWITQNLLPQPSKILDLGCGPGLYCTRLASQGHTCTGIDFSPASIAYAREQSSPRCTYHQADVRQADFGFGYDLVMFIFGEFNVFRPEDGAHILRKAAAALHPGGHLLLEVNTFEAVRRQSLPPTSWYSTPNGLFSERPHLCLEERFWHPERHVTTERYLIIDAQTSEVTRYAASTQAYTPEDYRALLESCGFQEVIFWEHFGAETLTPESSLQAITATIR